MNFKLAAIAVAAVLTGPVFAQTMISNGVVVPPGTPLVVPAGASASVIVEPTVASTAMSSSTAVLGAGAVVPVTPDAVRIDINNTWNIPAGAERRGDFQRWLRLR